MACHFTGNRGCYTGPMQHHPDHGQLCLARTGNLAGGYAKRVEVQRRAVDTRLPGRVRGEGRAVHAGRAERDPGRGQFGTVAEQVRRRWHRPVHHQKRPFGAEHAHDGGQVAANVPADSVQRQRTRPDG